MPPGNCLDCCRRTERFSHRRVSESAWLEEAVREKLAAESEIAYLMKRAARANRAAYGGVLNRVPSAVPEPGDERKRGDSKPATAPDPAT